MNDEVRARSTTVALVVVTVRGRVHFYAVDGTQSWSGRVQTSNEDAVVFDAVLDIVADRQGCEHTRIVVRLRPTSRLRAHVRALEAVLPGVSIGTPTEADESLMGAARIGVATTFLSGPPADLPPLVVATDGSLRGNVTGYGWLASSGDFGLRGFRHSTGQVGRSVVLIAELRAINNAVRVLPYQRLTVLTDSRSVQDMVRQWIVGDDVLPTGYATERCPGPEDLVQAQRRMRIHQNRMTCSGCPGTRVGCSMRAPMHWPSWRRGSPAGTAVSRLGSTGSAPWASQWPSRVSSAVVTRLPSFRFSAIQGGTMRIFGCMAGVLAAGAVAFAPPAQADQYEFISFLDDSGVSYASMLDMIEIGKAVCHDLRSGDTPPLVLGRLVNVGFAPAEATLVLVSAVSHLCVDTKPGVNEWAFQQGYTGQAL